MHAEALAEKPFRILFVCTGNTCRSPMAEVIARRDVALRGWHGVEIRSAGTSTQSDAPASGGAAWAARRHGLDLDAHRSVAVSPELVAWADLILVMTPGHQAAVVEAGGGAKVQLLVTFARGDGARDADASVPDPFGGSDLEYEATFAHLETLVESVVHHIAPLVES